MSQLPLLTDLPGLPDLRELERRCDRLEATAQALHEEHSRTRAELATQESFLELAPRAEELLRDLGQALFGELLDEIEAGLTQAIREILGQQRTVASTRETKGGRLHVHFHIEQDGQVEDILHGQGGSVCNIVSVSLRLLALSQLDPGRHRPFIVLDEQDCWLKPDLVPRFMSVIAEACRTLGLQALVISHHPMDLLARHAERVYRLAPSQEHGVALHLEHETLPHPAYPDASSDSE